MQKGIGRKIVPVVVIDDADDAVGLCEALLEGGMDVVEVTFRTAAAAGAIERIKQALPEMLVGAGTVLTGEQAEQCLDIGVDFALAPGLNERIVERFADAEVLFIPGVMTPSEIEWGLDLGCKLMKYFPAESAGGIKMLKSIAGPYGETGVKLCPTGGVSLENMMDYLEMPVVECVGGSWLATREQISGHEWDTITGQARKAMRVLLGEMAAS
ncbi:bifunctional 4-hydroxy-2-oxoglutarate aldolase/2-dehydro-3-deoxy-phosphogluconate aldolase [Poriferisphaera corsica]|nr:bifunctional 4-hydroxy-2-oxoglutarate aldolase/2-dehydro-3-deoxy-phosphogluconate aldolase [Poriferisphaera corsica]